MTHMMLSWPTLSRRVVNKTERPNASWYKLEIGGPTKLALMICWANPRSSKARGKNHKELHTMWLAMMSRLPSRVDQLVEQTQGCDAQGGWILTSTK